ncbi:MAG: lysylphosphatidylglycerol synthase domain-containing protein [Cumulibacter sp.]
MSVDSTFRAPGGDPNASEEHRDSEPLIESATGFELEGAETPSDTKSAWMRFASIVATIVILYLVFFVVLPSIASYEDIWDAIRSMSVAAAITLIVSGLLLIAVTGLQLAAALEGLRFGPAVITQPMSSAIGAIVPGGAIASRAVFLRPFGVEPATYARSYAASAFSVTACVLVMPSVGLIIFLLASQSPDARDMRTLALIAAVVALVIAAVLLVMVSSAAVCRWVARTGTAIVAKSAWLSGKLQASGWEMAVAQWREDTVQIVRQRRWRLGASVLATYWGNGALMIACMYACGLPYSAMSILIGLATWSLARLLLSVPLTPGGVGVLELGYAAVFTAMVAESLDESVVAGVLLYRALTYVLPIFLGGVLILIMRLRGNTRATSFP